MVNDVFISYAYEDKLVAETICKALEKRNIKCWIAPRDVLPGISYPEALVKAIDESRMMALIFSAHSNVSPHAIREVERAVNIGLKILPIRIEDIEPSPSMKYYIGISQWFDATVPPLERYLDHLVDVVRILLLEIDAGKPRAPKVPDVPIGELITCTWCGRQNTPDALYCESCGQKVEPKINIVKPEVTEAYQEEFVQGGYTPWYRLLARLADYYVFIIILNAVMSGLIPNFSQFFTGIVGDISYSIFLIFSWLFVEAALLSVWGFTPGKWLFNINVREASGVTLPFSRALKRSFEVWVKGMACGIPFAYFVTLGYAYYTIFKEGSTSWDKSGGFVVTQKKIDYVRIGLMVLLIILFIYDRLTALQMV